MRIQSRIQAHINLDAIDYNLKNMYDYMGKNTQIIAVLKADGYGHGAVPIAKEIEAYSYIWGIAVATVEEGRELRKAGIKKPILILGYTYEEDYDRIVKEDFQPTVFKLSMAEQLSKAAVKSPHRRRNTGNRGNFKASKYRTGRDFHALCKSR